jgi:glycosyltransferase involved in cell wall biosynthesis
MTAPVTASAAFPAYLAARDAVQRIKAAQAGTATGADARSAQASSAQASSAPSAYWAEELEYIDYLAEASPLIVAKLRHHAFPITGIRPYDYRDRGDGDSKRRNFELRLRALQALGGEPLLVPESPALGGFGYEIDGRLFNIDTLKFCEVLIGMERAGILGAMRAIDRPTVCEIGAGWGGFAYQFKTLFPRARYVIVDFPELFLFSATYLASVFPRAKMLFAGTSPGGALERWEDADFIFVPNTLARLIAALPLDLTVNMVSFQEMTDAQVREYARLAAAAGCPWLYSLNRERSPYNRELVSVREALSESYALTDIKVLGTDYSTATKSPPLPARDGERGPLDYRHSVGHRPRVVLGMTLYNNARHLGDAVDSLLAQTHSEFTLVMLDDASTDDSERIGREYAARDPRVRYFRQPERRAMIATWRDVVDLAARECPSADYFAWVSDHDRWDPRWLERMVRALNADPGVVLAYPITRRMTPEGETVDKGDRLFDSAGFTDLRARWSHFCRNGVGAGDMVYGLVRFDAFRRAGVFRTVLRPDRLLIAELTLLGRITQVPELLWFRRQSAQSSIVRQRQTLVVAGQEPPWFSTPPWLQHARLLWREYAAQTPPPLPLSRRQWAGMLLEYQLTYGWRHLRKSETSHAVGRGIDNVIWVKKITKHYYHHAVYHTLVGGRLALGRTRRLLRRGLYHVLVLGHRLGLRGRGETPVQ